MPLIRGMVGEEVDMVSFVEERREKMVPHTGGTPTLRLARFLKPSIVCIYQVEKSLPGVNFSGWGAPQLKWEQWINQLKPMYGKIWKRTGIYDSIRVSTYQFVKEKELILGLADSWWVWGFKQITH